MTLLTISTIRAAVSLETLRRAALYLAPVLVLVPLFSWTLQAGQLSQPRSYASAPLSITQPQFVQRSNTHPTWSPLVTSERSGASEPAEANPIRPPSWFKAFHRANEFLNAQAFTTVDPVKPHDPVEWNFARSLTRDLTLAALGAPEKMLPEVNPVTRLSLFAPPADDTFRTIMLDPGHGGSDPGTVGANGLLEKHLTLDIAKRVQNLLAVHPNIDVVLTRQDDKGYSRSVRMMKVHATQPDILISLHFNNLPQKNLTLVESFYAAHRNIRESESGRNNMNSRSAGFNRKSDYPFVKESRRLADLLQSQLFHQVSQTDSSAINAGTKQDTLFMLTRSYVPATLIELTCLSNSQEEERLKTSEYRQDIAIALAKGILEFFSTQNSNVKS